MTNPTPTQNPAIPSTQTPEKTPSIFRCFSGSLVAGTIAIALYFVTSGIAQSFAAKPIHSANFTVVNITVAVRTLVVGMSTLGTGIFGLAAVGLFALGLQTLIQQMKGQASPPSDI